MTNQHTGRVMPCRDYEWIYGEYVVKGRSQIAIAAECECSQDTVSYWLARHGIPSRSASKKLTRPYRAAPKAKAAPPKAMAISNTAGPRSVIVDPGVQERALEALPSELRHIVFAAPINLDIGQVWGILNRHGKNAAAFLTSAILREYPNWRMG